MCGNGGRGGCPLCVWGSTWGTVHTDRNAHGLGGDGLQDFLTWTEDQPTNFNFSSGNYEFNGFIFYNDKENIELEFSKVKLDDYFQGKALYKFRKLENFLLIFW